MMSFNDFSKLIDEELNNEDNDLEEGALATKVLHYTKAIANHVMGRT